MQIRSMTRIIRTKPPKSDVNSTIDSKNQNLKKALAKKNFQIN